MILLGWRRWVGSGLSVSRARTSFHDSLAVEEQLAVAAEGAVLPTMRSWRVDVARTNRLARDVTKATPNRTLALLPYPLDMWSEFS